MSDSNLIPADSAPRPGLLSGLPALGAAWHLLPWAVALSVFAFLPQYLPLGTTVLVMVLLTLSLDIALGYAGIVTLGHAAFFGLGAYTAGLFAIHFNNDPLLGLLAATLVTAAFGCLVGMLILHTEGVTLLMLTLSIAAVLAEVANQAKDWTGGDDGLQGMTMGLLLGWFRFDLAKKTAYLYALAVLFVWFVIAWRVVHSPFGRSLDGIRQNPARMRAIGTPVWLRLVAAYTLSAAMAGSAGALQAQTTRFVALNSLALMVSGMAVVMLVLGGTRRLYGAFVGATIYVVVQDQAAQVNPYYWMLVIGLLLMGTVLLLQGGLISLLDAGRAMLRRMVRGGRA